MFCSFGCVQEEFSHPVESLALTVDEVINVRRVLVKAEMEKFLQSKELYNNLKKGKVKKRKLSLMAVSQHQQVCLNPLGNFVCVHMYMCVPQVCCCCRVKFPLFSWPSTCLLCKRYQSKLSSHSLRICLLHMPHLSLIFLIFHLPNQMFA